MKFTIIILLVCCQLPAQPETLFPGARNTHGLNPGLALLDGDSTLLTALPEGQRRLSGSGDWQLLEQLDTLSSWHYSRKNFSQAILYLEKQDSLLQTMFHQYPEVMQRIHLQESQKRTAFKLIHSRHEIGQYRQALNRSSRLLEQASDLEMKSNELLKAQSWSGLLHYFSGDLTAALHMNLQALFLAEKLQNPKEQATIFSRLGFVHRDLKNYPQALDFFRRSTTLTQQQGDYPGMVTGWNEIGNVHLLQARYDSALTYKYKALETARKNNYERGVSFVTNDIAMIYQLQGDSKTALKFYLQTLVYERKSQNVRDLVITLMNIGGAYHSLKMNPEAIQYLNEALTYARKSHLQELAAKSYLNLSMIYAEQQSYETAYRNLAESKELSDELMNLEKLSALTEIQTQYAVEKKEQELNLIKKDHDLQALSLKKAALLRNFLIMTVMLSLILAGVLYNRYQLKHKANALMTGQNQRLQELNAHLDAEIKQKEAALEKVSTLRGLLPICASCKKIRDDDGYWHQVENYICDHSDAEFSHGICPDCMKQLYPNFRSSRNREAD
jgi:tetratricopeptide (TPR) repeat protein